MWTQYTLLLTRKLHCFGEDRARWSWVLAVVTTAQQLSGFDDHFIQIWNNLWNMNVGDSLSQEWCNSNTIQNWKSKSFETEIQFHLTSLYMAKQCYHRRFCRKNKRLTGICSPLAPIVPYNENKILFLHKPVTVLFYKAMKYLLADEKSASASDFWRLKSTLITMISTFLHVWWHVASLSRNSGLTAQG